MIEVDVDSVANMANVKRIQMSRQHAWRAENAGAIIVARGVSSLGNPFRIYQHCKPGKLEDGTRHQGDWGIEDSGRFNHSFLHGYTKLGAARMACTMYRQELDKVFVPGSLARLILINELAGHDLACWCPILDPDTEQWWPCGRVARQPGAHPRMGTRLLHGRDGRLRRRLDAHRRTRHLLELLTRQRHLRNER